MATGAFGNDIGGGPAPDNLGETRLLALILGALQGNGTTAVGGGGTVGTYTAIHVANNESGTIPVTAKRWAVNFVGTGTTNTFLTNTAVTGGQGFLDNATPAAPIPIVCDGSTVADGFYSTT